MNRHLPSHLDVIINIQKLQKQALSQPISRATTHHDGQHKQRLARLHASKK
jgi:hypothetical protein